MPRPYPPVFRAEAIRLARNGERPNSRDRAWSLPKASWRGLTYPARLATAPMHRALPADRPSAAAGDQPQARLPERPCWEC